MVLLLLIAVLLGQENSPREIPYRLLQAEIPSSSDRLKEAAFAVSVERSLSRPEVERLICGILKKEDPPKFERLNIQVFINLDQYTGDGSPNETEHQLAWFAWDSKLPRIRGRLVIAKDAEGKPLGQLQSREFDQAKVCSRDF